jgi:hypothetical protein
MPKIQSSLDRRPRKVCIQAIAPGRLDQLAGAMLMGGVAGT